MSVSPLPRFQLTRPVPVLWRAPEVLQLGLDQCLILDRVPRALAEAVPLLNKPRSVAELATLLPQLSSSWLEWLLHQLRDSGFAQEAPPRPAGRVQLVGTGTLAEALAKSIRAAGIDLLRPRLNQLPESCEGGSDLVVLAGRTAEPDRAITDTLFRADQDHLVIRIEPDRSVVGPLVFPGRSPCIRCQDLAHVRQDPAWPQLLAQLCRLAVKPDPVLLAWAAASGAAQVRAWAAGHPVDSCGTSLELGIPEHRLLGRSWGAEAACGCLLPPT